MNKYILASLCIHLCFILSFGCQEQKQLKLEKEQLQEEGKKGGEPEIIEISVGPGDEPVKQDKFYWGVGINHEYTYFEDYLGIQIKEIYEGYSAATSGLQVGDIIIKIDDVELDGYGNDLRGDGPRKMVLTFIRNGARMNLTIERVKVYQK